MPFSSSKVYCNDRTPWYNYTTQKLHAKPLISALEVGYFYKVSSLSSRNMQYEYILISSFNFNSLSFSFTKIKDLIYFFRRGKLSYTSLSLDSLSKTFHFCSLEFYIRIDSRTINSGHQNKKFCLKTDGARLEVRPILARKVNCMGRLKKENMWNFPQRPRPPKNPHIFSHVFHIFFLLATREGNKAD